MAVPAPRAPIRLQPVDLTVDPRADGAPAPPGGVLSSAPRARGAGGGGPAEVRDVSRRPRLPIPPPMAPVDLLADVHLSVIGRALG